MGDGMTCEVPCVVLPSLLRAVVWRGSERGRGYMR